MIEPKAVTLLKTHVEAGSRGAEEIVYSDCLCIGLSSMIVLLLISSLWIQPDRQKKAKHTVSSPRIYPWGFSSAPGAPLLS